MSDTRDILENLEISVERVTDWDLVKEFAMATIGKEFTKSPASVWKAKILRCEHSPIRSLEFKIVLKNVPSWVSVHFVRHSLGITHFVSTQRDDRNEGALVSRNDKPQSSPVMHKMFVNAAEILFISRRRLCGMASKETRNVWARVVDAIREIEPELAAACVPECVYRGGYCPEFVPCRYNETEACKERITVYQNASEFPTGKKN